MPILAAPLAWLAETSLMKGPVGSVLYAIGRGIKAFFKMLDWQGWIGLIAAMFCAWHWYSAAADARHWEKQDGRDAKVAAQYKVQFDSISTKRNVQKQVSTVTVEKVVKGDPEVRTIVQHIHDAPIPADCGTPDVSELRNVL